MLGVRTHNSVSLARPAGVTVRKERQGRTRRLELLREQAKVSATPEPGGSAEHVARFIGSLLRPERLLLPRAQGVTHCPRSVSSLVGS